MFTNKKIYKHFKMYLKRFFFKFALYLVLLLLFLFIFNFSVTGKIEKSTINDKVSVDMISIQY